MNKQTTQDQTNADFEKMVNTPKFLCLLTTTAVESSAGANEENSQSISASMTSNVEVSDFSLGK